MTRDENNPVYSIYCMQYFSFTDLIFSCICFIGVGVSINIKELGLIASDPSDSHLFMVDDLEVNNKILKSLLKSQICRGISF